MLRIDRRDKADTVGTLLLFFVVRQTEGKKTQSLNCSKVVLIALQ